MSIISRDARAINFRMRSMIINRLFDGFRLYWIVPVLIGLYGIFGHPNTSGFVFPAFCASVACGLALQSANYYPLSFISITAIVHAVSYPIACVLNLMLPEPGVYESFLWYSTVPAMWACVVGMLGLATGVKLSLFFEKAIKKRGKVGAEAPNRSFDAFIPSPYTNLYITLVAVPVLLFMLAQGFYFHSQLTGTGEYNFDAAAKWAFLDYLVLLSYAGTFFQLRRYAKSRKRSDAIWAIALISIFVLLFAPSGSRDKSLTVAVLAFPAFWALENRWRIKLRVLTGAIVVFIAITVIIQMYRYSSLTTRAVTLKENFQLLTDTIERLSLKDIFASEESHFIVARRLADYVATGWYISIVPHTMPFRYFENVRYWPLLILPVFIRPSLPHEVVQESASLTYETSGYGWHLPGEGSSPVMILGDLYTRFGWPGIFFGMLLLGMIVVRFDNYFKKRSLHKDILFVMMWVTGWKILTQSSLTGVFIYFTRTFAICWGISFLASYFVKLFGYRWNKTRLNHNKKRFNSHAM